jgi:hypothetical protein
MQYMLQSPLMLPKKRVCQGKPSQQEKKAAQLTVIKKGILLLNNDLPEEFSLHWVTAEDLWRRLLHVGVRKSLTLEFVHNPLQRKNSNQTYFKSWLYNGT